MTGETVVHATLRVSQDRATFDGCGRTASVVVPADRHRLDDAIWQLGEVRRGRAVLWAPERTVHEAGVALGDLFASSAVAEAVIAALREVRDGGRALRLALVVDDDELHALPWESLVVPGIDLPLVLQDGVQFYRRAGDRDSPAASSLCAPLRVLAVLARPDDGDRALDMEDEQRRIVEAFESAQRSGRAWLRFPGTGTLATLGHALREHRFHVLHLACHAAPGRLTLEAEDGSPKQVAAEELLSAIPAGRLPDVVVLSGCSTASGAGGEAYLPGIAHALVRAGVPQVIAMTGPVPDLYARKLGGLLYRELADAEEPDVLSALSHARRVIEAGADVRAGEWSLPALFTYGVPAPLFRPADGAEKLAAPSEATVPGIAVRGVGDFVGRRADRRLLTAALRDPESAGCVVYGIGGSGKSVLAVELLRGEPVPGAAIVAVVGVTTPTAILGAVADVLAARIDPTAAAAGIVEHLRDTGTPWQSRLRTLRTEFLETTPLLLLIDNAESNLVLGPAGDARFADPELGEFLLGWIGDPGHGRLLVTSRHPLPLPDTGGRLTDHQLGPLSYAEAGQLMWRLPGLNLMAPSRKFSAYERVGGHPRGLEYLDALLRSGGARFPDLAERIDRLLRERGITDPGAWLRGVGGRGFSASAAEAIALAAGDALLGTLLNLLTPSALDLLIKAAVFDTETNILGLSWQDDTLRPGLDNLHDLLERLYADDFTTDLLPPQCARAGDPQLSADLAELTRLGLLTAIDVTGSASRLLREAGVRGPIPDLPEYLTRHYFVHRWTAAAIAQLHPERTRAAHIDAARFYTYMNAVASRTVRHIDTDQQRAYARYALGPLEAARRHFRDGEDLDSAVFLPYLLAERLTTWGLWDALDGICRETLERLDPAESPRTRWEAAVCHLRLGQLDQLRGSLRSARDHSIEAIRLIEAGSDRRQLGSALHLLGNIEDRLGDRAAARDHLQRSIQFDADRGEDHAIARYDLANMELDAGRLDRAEELLHEVRARFEATDDRLHAARAQHSQGRLAAHRGDASAAAGHYRAALAVFEAQDDRFDIVRCHNALGDLSRDQHDLPRAEDSYRVALRIATDIGDMVGQATALSGLARINEERDDPGRATGYQERALALYRQIGDTAAEGASRYRLVRFAQQSGALAEQRPDLDAAADAYRRGLRQARATGVPELVANLSFQLAEVLQRQGRTVESLDAFRELLPLAQELGEARQTAVVHYKIAQLETARGHFADAIRHAALAVRVFPDRATDVNAACVALLRGLRIQVGSIRFDQQLAAADDGEPRAPG